MKSIITSLQNPLVKSVLRLQQKASERRATGTFAAEGRREVSLALRHGIKAEKLIICPEIFKPDTLYPIPFDKFESSVVAEVSVPVYNKMAYREGCEGVILIGRMPNADISTFNPGKNPLIVVLEGVEKPGNLGAILRTTDAAGVDGVLLCDIRTDLYNPNAIRASLGCVFSQTIITCESSEAIAWLKKNRISIFAATPESTENYFDAYFTGPAAIAFGAEDEGLSKPWIEKSDKVVKIPMNGVIDSLNVSASVAIMVFEAVRQRSS